MLQILCSGLLVACIIYPLLHEMGHALAATIFAKEVKIVLFPFPGIICDTADSRVAGISIIGMAGMLFPFLISLFVNEKTFWLWLISFFLKGISTIAFFLSYVALICYRFGVLWKNEDVVKIIEITGVDVSILEVILLFLLFMSLWIINNDAPISKFANFLFGK